MNKETGTYHKIKALGNPIGDKRQTMTVARPARQELVKVMAMSGQFYL